MFVLRYVSIKTIAISCSTSLSCSSGKLGNKEVYFLLWSLCETSFQTKGPYKVITAAAFDAPTNNALTYLAQLVTKRSVHRGIDDWVADRMHACYKRYWMKNNVWNAYRWKWLQKMHNDKRGPTYNKNEKHRENHLRCLRFAPKIFLWLSAFTPSLNLLLVETHFEENSQIAVEHC